MDYETDTEVSGDAERGIIDSIHRNAADASAIVVSDYLKGCITRRVFAAAIEDAEGFPITRMPISPSELFALRQQHRKVSR